MPSSRTSTCTRCPPFSRVKVLLLWLISLVSSAGVFAQTSDWTRAVADADAKILRLKQMLRSGSTTQIQNAVLELQADPLSVNRLNRLGSDSLKNTCNRVIESLQQKTAGQVSQTIAKKYGVKPSEVKVNATTNPSTGQIKVGQDWDVTVRVRGKDIPTKIASRAVHDAYYSAASGKALPTSGSVSTFRQAADAFAEKQCVEVTNYLHNEAYGASPSDGTAIIQGNKGLGVRDPAQLSKVISYKSDLAAERAVLLEAQGRTMEAQRWRLEQARQSVKQFDRQVKPRLEAMGRKVPSHIQKSMEVLRKVEQGQLSPAEVEAVLKRMGTSIQRLTHDSGALVEAGQNLRSPGAARGGPAVDPVAENVRNKMELRRLANKAANPTGEVPQGAAKDLGTPRKGGVTKGVSSSSQGPGMGQKALNFTGKGLGYLMALLAVKEGGEISYAAGEAIGRYAVAKTPEEADQALEDLEQAATEGTVLFGVTLLAKRHPVSGVGFLSYGVTRLALENTERGRAFEEGVPGFEDLLGQRLYNFWDDVGGVFGCETRFDKKRLAQLERVDAYKRAFEAGTLQMKEGLDEEAFLFFVRTLDSTDPDFKDLRDLMTEKPEVGPNVPGMHDLARRLNDPDLTAVQKEQIIAELTRQGLWPPPATEVPNNRPQIAQALAAVRSALAGMQGAVQPILNAVNSSAITAAGDACKGMARLQDPFSQQVQQVEGLTESAVDSISAAGIFPEAEKPLRQALRAIIRAADHYRQAQKLHDEILRQFGICERARQELDRCVRLARECGSQEDRFYQVCSQQTRLLTGLDIESGPEDAAGRALVTSAITEIGLLRAQADQLRGSVTDALSTMQLALEPCETIEPPILEIVQQTREQFVEADAGFNAVQFILASRLGKRQQELEETQELLEKRGVQKDGRTKRIDYLQGHLDTRRKALNAQVSADKRKKLTTEATEIAKDLKDNQQVVLLIEEDVEKREQDEENLKPTISLLGEIGSAMPSAG